MPYKPARPCAQPGCPKLTTNKERYCDEHLKQRNQQIDAQRGSAAERGYDWRWHKASKAYLITHPLCAICLKKTPPIVREATLVDHIIPHKGNPDLFWDENNWQSACKECHDIKTAKEDGAFGNKQKG